MRMLLFKLRLTFPINELGESNTGGSYWPTYLPVKIDGDNIIIKRNLI